MLNARIALPAVAVALACAVAAPSFAAVVTSPTDDIVSIRHSTSSMFSVGGSSPATEGPARAVDGDPTTKYLIFGITPQQPGFIITPAAGPTSISGFRFATGDDAPNRDPLQIVIGGSNAFTSSANALATDADTD